MNVFSSHKKIFLHIESFGNSIRFSLFNRHQCIKYFFLASLNIYENTRATFNNNIPKMYILPFFVLLTKQTFQSFRLGLERGKTAKEALEVITSLLEEFGQGGPCSDIVPEHVYHNSFLIVDPNEAWVLETARNLWVAQKITNGVRNISNCMSIQTDIDLMSKDLLKTAKEENWWNGNDTFNWELVIGEAALLPSTKLTTPHERYCAGRKLLMANSEKSKFFNNELLL